MHERTIGSFSAIGNANSVLVSIIDPMHAIQTCIHLTKTMCNVHFFIH